MNRIWLFTAIIIVIILYIGLSLRYYYKVEKTNITILQCDVNTFEPQILKEKMPIVCRGVGFLDDLQKEYKKINKNLKTQKTINHDIYNSLRIQPFFCKRNNIVWKNQKSDVNKLVQSRCDYLMLIQISGKQEISVYDPKSLDFLNHLVKQDSDNLYKINKPTDNIKEYSKASYINIIMNEGDALILPFQWWYSLNNSKELQCNYCILSWENTFMKYINPLFL